MTKLVKLKTDEGMISIESAINEQTDGATQAGGIDLGTNKKLSDLLKIISPITKSLMGSIENLTQKPNNVSVEFGLSLTAGGNIFVAKAAGKASLKITFTWSG